MDYKKTFILGFGFFAISLVWPLYNFFIPLFLKEYIDSQFLINAIMTLDNILAIFMIPYFASRSDRTNTRFGRRMPYLLIGIPISAIIFAILPAYTSLLSLLIIIFLLNVSMAVYRAPTVALMPDITPVAYRSKANGIINFMGGLAAVLVLALGGIMYEKINRFAPFVATAVLMILALVILYKYIKEPKKGVESAEEKISMVKSMKEIIENEDKTTFYILMAVFFWFVGYQGVEATFSNYSVYFLGIKESMGALILSSFAGMFLVFAIPSGYIAAKVGKKKTIQIGIIGLMVTFGLLGFVRTSTTIFSIPFNVIMMTLLGAGGFFWAFININSYPMVVEAATEEKIGTYTGLYYFSSSLAAILGPLVFGFFVDLIGYESMFFTSTVSFLIAFVCVWKIKTETEIKVTDSN